MSQDQGQQQFLFLNLQCQKDLIFQVFIQSETVPRQVLKRFLSIGIILLIRHTSSPIKLIYVESIRDPDKLLHHASSLIRKGCRIAAIKAGTTEAGSRAASSHTGAMASSDSGCGSSLPKSRNSKMFRT